MSKDFSFSHLSLFLACLFNLNWTIALAQNSEIILADEMVAQGKYLDAAQTYIKNLSRENESFISPKIGNCFLLLADYKQAETYYERAMKYGQRKTTDIFNYAECLKNNLKFVEAKKWYTEALLKDPKNKTSRRMLNSCTMYLDNCKNGTCSAINPSKNCFTFDAMLSIDSSAPNLIYQWEFDSGEKLEGTVVNYCFPGAGRRKVNLNTYVKGDDFSIKTDTSFFLTIEGLPISFKNPETPAAMTDAMFDASYSAIDGATITDYFWDFGDGSLGLGNMVNHRFQTAGNFTVKLTLTAQSIDGKQEIIYCGYKKINVVKTEINTKSLQIEGIQRDSETETK